MKLKILEIRDTATFVPAVAIDMNPENDTQRWYLRRLGFPCDGERNIALFHLDCSGEPVWNDPYGWPGGARTWSVAHEWILRHWDELEDGSVVCVETILGERETPKVSERLSHEH